MTTMLFRHLIDAAIGSPEPGHVDFYALQCVLYHLADKLDLVDCVVDNSKYHSLFKGRQRHSKCKKKSFSSRLFAGAIDVNASAATVEEVAEVAPVNEIDITQIEETAEAVEEEETEEAVSEDADDQVVTTSELIVETVSTAQPAVVELAKSTASILAAKPETGNASLNIEGKIQYLHEPVSEGLLMGISIMKEQIELAMEQINMLANMEIFGQRKSLLINLKGLNKKMRSIQHANYYVASKTKFLEQESTLEESLEQEDEEGMENIEEMEEADLEFQTAKQVLKIEPKITAAAVPPSLDYHLCYSPERIMDELLDLKSEFCNLTNKFNDLMVGMQEIDSQRTKVILSELQEQMREARYILSVLKDAQEFLNNKQKGNNEKMLNLEKSMNLLRTSKVDHTVMELALAEKVNYDLLERKVSHDQLKEAVCRIENQFCEMQRLVSFNEKHALQVIENMRKNLGLDKIEQMLKDFRNKVDKDIEKLQAILRNYLDSTNDDCAAAGARVQVFKDLACISCDTKCVMRSMEKAKVGKLPNAHVTPALGPLITSKLGSIRKSGIMGYYRKDEFPHAPHAWMEKTNIALNVSLPRHAGGPHTTHTPKQIIDKVVKRVK